jgi:hypothetical protein
MDSSDANQYHHSEAEYRFPVGSMPEKENHPQVKASCLESVQPFPFP